MDPFAIFRTIKEGYSKLPKAPEIVAVSLKNVADVNEALASGVDAVGMRYPLIKAMMEHPLSQKAELLFASNWAKVKGEDISYLKHALQSEGIAE
jgi:transaldolase